MKLALRLDASNSWNNLVELKFVLQPRQIKIYVTAKAIQRGRQRHSGNFWAPSRQLYRKKRQQCTSQQKLPHLGSGCHDGEEVMCSKLWQGKRGREEDERLGAAKSGWTRAARRAVLTRAPTDLLPRSFSCCSHGKQMWNVTLFRLKVPHLTQGHDQR